MRVAAYTGGVMVPSARARVRQYIDPLRELGIHVREWTLPFGNRLPQTRSVRPLWMGATALTRAASLTCSWTSDVTWISRQLLPAFTPIHALAKRPMVLDVDDAVWLNTGGHRAEALARASSLVVCGNSFLATQFSRWNKNVAIVPTAVDTTWYRPQQQRDSAELVLGWTGTSGNFPFLHSIEPALEQVFAVYPRASLLVVADRPPQFRRLPAARVAFEPWSPQGELAAFARMSIGLMPLAQSDWCNGKCSYKMLCYMAAGLPVVVTAEGMNREVLALGRVGLGVVRDEQWVEMLSALLGNAALRNSMGAAGRAVVERHFSLNRLAQKYAELFQSLNPNSARGSRIRSSCSKSSAFAPAAPKFSNCS